MHSRKITAARRDSSSNFRVHWRGAAGVSWPRRARGQCGSGRLVVSPTAGSEGVRRRAGLEGPCEPAGRGGGGRNERRSACTNKWPRFWVINTRAARKEGSVPTHTHAHTHAPARPLAHFGTMPQPPRRARSAHNTAHFCPPAAAHHSTA